MTSLLPPRQLLETNVVLTPVEVAWVLGLKFERGEHAGEPNPLRVRELVASGDLFPVDPSQPAHRCRYSVPVVQRYLDDRDRIALERNRRSMSVAS